MYVCMYARNTYIHTNVSITRGFLVNTNNEANQKKKKIKMKNKFYIQYTWQ